MYHYWDLKLIREQLDQKMAKFRNLGALYPSSGWIKVVREALGMSLRQLGKKANLDPSRISRLEKAEMSGELKLSTLRKIAEALDMEFVYAFVPKTDLEAIVRDQAKKIAIERMAKLNHTMRLEKQELSEEEKKKSLQDMIDKIVFEEQKKIWD